MIMKVEDLERMCSRNMVSKKIDENIVNRDLKTGSSEYGKHR